MEKEMTSIAIGIDILKDAGYHCFVCFFYGGGDSGDFEESHVIPRELVCEETGDLLVGRHDEAFADAVQNTPELPDQVQEMIPSSYYQEHDWWNNEGGSGYIVVDLEKRRWYTHYDINGEETTEPPIGEDGEPDYDNYEPEYNEWTECGMGVFEI